MLIIMTPLSIRVFLASLPLIDSRSLSFINSFSENVMSCKCELSTTVTMESTSYE